MKLRNRFHLSTACKPKVLELKPLAGDPQSSSVSGSSIHLKLFMIMARALVPAHSTLLKISASGALILCSILTSCHYQGEVFVGLKILRTLKYTTAEASFKVQL